MRRDHLTRRLVAAVVLLFGVLLVTPGISSAAPYPAPSGAGTVSSGTATVGGKVVFSGTGFIPGEQILIGGSTADAGGMLGETVADTNGDFRFTVTLPAVGMLTLQAYGVDSDHLVTAVVRVLAAGGNTGAGANGSTLPVTGTGPIAPIALGGAAMLVLGAALVGVTRRRRTAEI
jgi:LPXTG-motif cell wall-anchored protein